MWQTSGDPIVTWWFNRVFFSRHLTTCFVSSQVLNGFLKHCVLIFSDLPFSQMRNTCFNAFIHNGVSFWKRLGACMSLSLCGEYSLANILLKSGPSDIVMATQLESYFRFLLSPITIHTGKTPMYPRLLDSTRLICEVARSSRHSLKLHVFSKHSVVCVNKGPSWVETNDQLWHFFIVLESMMILTNFRFCLLNVGFREELQFGPLEKKSQSSWIVFW